MQIKLDLYVNVYIVQPFLLDAKFKTTHCPFGGVPAGPKIGWYHSVTFSAQCSFYSFSYGKVFHKTFFHQNPGLFFAISLLSSQWCQVRGLSCPLPCVLRPPLGWCLTLVLCCSWWMWGRGQSSRRLFPFPVNSQSQFGGGGWKLGFAESLAQIFWPERQDPGEPFLLDMH